ncbi:MAG: substrate-binding domain-containing protein [Clostridia bacterium]|nr:substrate-binding domain-containing protein [Clostridia bacterium]
MNYIEITAKALGISKTTVYRSQKTTGNVSPRTRERINRYISEHFPEKIARFEFNAAHSNGKAKFLTFIMPNKPSFFWDDVICGIKKAEEKYEKSNVIINYYFYSGDINEKEIYSILCRLEKLLPDGIAIVPTQSSEIAEMVRNISERIPVVFLNDYCNDCENVARVITNGIEEGRKIGEIMCSQISDGTVLVLLSDGFESSIFQERLRGFKDYCSESGSNLEITEIAYESNGDRYVSNTILPSLLARTIAKEMQSRKNVKAVYIPNGICYQLMLAVKKLRRDDIYVYSHEADLKARRMFKNGMRGGYVTSDAFSQGYLASRYLCQKVLGDKTDNLSLITWFEFDRFD